MSPRQLAKTLLHHVRRTRIRALAAPRAWPWLRTRLHLPANEVFHPLQSSSPEVRIVPLDPAETFRRPLPVVAPEDAAALDFFCARRSERIEPSFVAEFTDGLAWGYPTGAVFTADGRFVPVMSRDPSGAEFHAVWTRWRLPPPRRLAGRTLYLVTPEAADNFHHWMIDLLPRLGLVHRAGYPLETFDHVIVNHQGRRFQLESLARFGIARERLVPATPELFVRADQMVVPSLKRSNQTLPAADLAFLRQAFLPAPPGPRRGRRIFLSRRDAAYRHLRDEATLRPLLESLEFEVVSTGAMSLEEQARLFAEAEVIAGPAGAAFANLVFASAPARVIEVAPPQWLAAFHWMISARLGLAHHLVLGRGRVMRGVPDAGARRQDIAVDLRSFARRFERALREPVLS